MRGLTKKIKLLPCKKLGETPPLNKEGYWKKPEPKEIKLESKNKNRSTKV